MRHRSVALGAWVCLVSASMLAADPPRDMGTLDPNAEQTTFWSRLEPEWYGYFKLDVAHDGSRTTPGQYAKWAIPEPTGDEINLTLNQTRLGLKLRASADEARFRAGGRVEIDLFGHVDDPDPRIRHAYLTFSWPEAAFDIIVGQTSDVISPLNPSTLNYTVAWWAGNIGFRRPQIRATKRFVTGGGDELRVEGALTHNIYDTKVGSVSGEDAGLAAQTRIAYSFARSGGPPVTLGISGHRAAEEFETGTTTERLDSWSANLDLTLPLSDKVGLQGELFHGKSLAPYLGGAGQGVGQSASPGPSSLHGIHSRGGWLAVSYATAPESKGRPRFNAGVSADDVKSDDLATGARELNRSVFGNVIFRLTRAMDAGFELSHWTTRYKGTGECDALRTQLSLIYKI